MVGRWGMSPAIGPVSVLPGPGQETPFGLGPNGPSPATQELIDAEIRRLLDEAAKQAEHVLSQHRSNLDSLVEALLEAETLDADAAYRAAGLARTSDPAPSAS
jgi:cell division protease FtsH